MIKIIPRARQRNLAAPAWALVLLAAVTTGCSAADSGHPAAVHPVPVPTPSTSVQLQLPLGAYMFTSGQSAEVSYLTNLLTKDCMTKLGFQYLPTLTSAAVEQNTRDFDEAGSRLWGVSDLVAAQEYGYHLPSWMASAASVQTIGSLPPAERQALYGNAAPAGGSTAGPAGHAKGIPAGGCAGQANRELAPAIGSTGGGAAQIVVQLNQQSFTQAVADPTVLGVFAKWSACMSAHGYHYPSPFAAAEAADLSGSVTQAEIQTAVTDVQCKLKTNLLGIGYAVQADIQDRMINQNATELTQIKAQVQHETAALQSLAAKYGIGG